MLEVGDRFDSFECFKSSLNKYEKSVYNKYWIRDCKTLKVQAQKYPNGLASQAHRDLHYYCVRFACIKGGRKHIPRNVQRHTLTFRQGCQAGMFLKLSSCGKSLELVELNEDHNHTVSKMSYQTLPYQRLNLPKVSSQEILQAQGNKKTLQNKITAETGCLITFKDLANLNRKPDCKKEFYECVNNLSNVYNCDVSILCDSEENLLCLFFQDAEMKKMFDAYPELIFVDGTYCLHESRTATYLIMVQDSEGNGAVVAAGILVNENQETIDWFIKRFKKSNPNSKEIKVIMSDKESKGRASFKRNLPEASLQICLFHTMQIFNREVSQKNMSLTNEECKTAKQFLTNLAYATSEDVYVDECKKMKASVPKSVMDYFEKHWHPIKDQWVLYLTSNNKSFFNRNNKLENMNQKLKSVILRFSNLEEFIKNFFMCINSSRVNRNMSNAFHFHKVSTNFVLHGSAEDSYKKLLTNYSFEKVQQQLQQMKECENVQVVENDKCLMVTSKGLLQVTTTSCKCSFWTSMGLPCRHILKFRSTLNMSLFDESLCLKRWTRSYFESHHPFLNMEEAAMNLAHNKLNVSKTESTLGKQRALTNHQKFKVVNNECLNLSKQCSKVSSDVFYKRLEFIRSLVKKWSNYDDEENHEKSLEMINDDNHSDTSDETNCILSTNMY